MNLYIKNMVCDRCKMVVKSELEKLGLHPVSVDLGEVEVQETNIDTLKTELLQKLQSLGFDLIDDKRSKAIEKVKTLIVNLVHDKNNDTKFNLSDYLTQHILQDYNTLSNLFTDVAGTTIEKYYINQKIEKVKELLVYDELTLSEIAFQLHYSSVSHLSNQFKKITGFTPTYYKQMKDKRRKQIDNL